MRDRSAITVNARQWDDDLRIATLEIQVDALQDATTQAELSSKAVAAEHDKRVKEYAWIATWGRWWWVPLCRWR